MNMNLPALGTIGDASLLRTVFYQSGRLVHGPYGLSSLGVSTFAQTLLDDADAAAARTTLAVPGLADANSFTGVNSFSEMVKLSMGTAIDDDDVDGSNILTLPTDGNAFIFSGTQQVDAIATIGGAGPIYLIHTSARTLTHHATNLILPGGADITTASGDISVWVEYATADWRCVSYQRSNTAPLPTIGTAGQFLQVNSGATGLQYVSGWEFIQTQTPSAVASANFTGLSAYRRLRLTGFLRPATDGQHLQIRTSTDNGSNYDNGAGNYAWQTARGAGTSATATASTAATEMQLTPDTAGNAANEGVQIDLVFDQFNQATYGWVNGNVSVIGTTGVLVVATVAANRLDATARDAFQVKFSGNISIGHLTLEGIRG